MVSEHVQPESRYKPFVGLSLATAALTLGLIVFGAIVRVTDSGLGCGNDWPLCNGTIFPPLDNITAWIEWLHRLFALLIGMFGLATLVVAWRHSNKQILGMTALAAALFVLQSGLGAIVVFLDLPPTFVTLHLGVAMLLFAALIAANVMAWYQPQRAYHADSISTLTNLNATFALLVILTGALVRGSGATLACTEWPLCDDGLLLPFQQGQLAVIHMIHRLAVAAMSLTILLLLRQVYRNRQENRIKQIALAICLAYLLQVGAGAMFVFSVAGPEWGALHVGLAAAVWGLLVALATIETLNRIGLRSVYTRTK